MTGYKHWFDIRHTGDPANRVCSVSFDPTGPLFEEVEIFRQRMAAATGQQEPLYNGYDWAMMFMNHLSAAHPAFRTRADDTDGVEIHGSTEGITAYCDTEGLAQAFVEKCVALLENEALVAQMIRDGLAVD